MCYRVLTLLPLGKQLRTLGTLAQVMSVGLDVSVEIQIVALKRFVTILTDRKTVVARGML